MWCEGGKAAFEALAAAPEPLHALLWRTSLAAADTASPEGRAGLKAELAAIAREIADKDVREQYEILFRLQFMEAFGWKTAAGGWQPSTLPIAKPPRRVRRPIEDQGHCAIAGVLLLPEVGSDHWEALGVIELISPTLLKVRGAISDALLHAPDLDRDALTVLLQTQGLSNQVKWILDNPRLPFSFLDDASSLERRRLQLACLIEELAALVLLYMAKATNKRQSREALNASGEDQALQGTRLALSDQLSALQTKRVQAQERWYVFAQAMGVDPDLRVRSRVYGDEPHATGVPDARDMSEKNGEDRLSIGGTY